METKRTLVAIYDDRDKAHRAINALEAAGFDNEEIGIIQRQPEQPVPGSDEPRMAANSHDKKEFREPADVAIAPNSDATNKTMTSYAVGGVAGGVLGAAVALLVPGIGPALAGGIITSVLLGVSGGATAGGIIGALTELGLPESEARFYGTQFEAGRTLVTVKAGERYDEAQKILQESGGRLDTNPADFKSDPPANYQASS